MGLPTAYLIVGFEILTTVVMKSFVFSDITLCVVRRKLVDVSKNYALLVTRFGMFLCLVYPTTLQMEATCSIETPDDFQQTTRL